MSENKIHIDEYEARWIVISSAVLGVFFASLLLGAVLFNVNPPDSTSTVNPLKLDETIFANPGVRHMGGNQYDVVILAKMWGYTPTEIRLPVGAEATFHVTSLDIIHGFYIEKHNVNFELIPGHVAETRVTFDEVGEWRILCHQYCGRGHQIMHMPLIIEDTDAEAVALDAETGQE